MRSQNDRMLVEEIDQRLQASENGGIGIEVEDLLRRGLGEQLKEGSFDGCTGLDDVMSEEPAPIESIGRSSLHVTESNGSRVRSKVKSIGSRSVMSTEISQSG